MNDWFKFVPKKRNYTGKNIQKNKNTEVNKKRAESIT
jgi:hypothetical protein